MDGQLWFLSEQAARTTQLLANRILVHTAPRGALEIAELLEHKPSGLVLSGTRPQEAVKETRRILGPHGPVLIDPAAYALERATPDEPFSVAHGSQRAITLADYLEQQLESGVSAAVTPTRYLISGDRGSLNAVADATATISPDAIVAVPLDAGWLSRQNVNDVIDTLSEIPQVKAVVLGGQFNPPERVRDGVHAVRRLAELPETMLFRTDMTAFDFLSRGGLGASIGSSSTFRHTIPPNEVPLRTDSRDPSPSVLVEDLVAYVRGSALAERFGEVTAPRCGCEVCKGDRITDWARRGRRDAARLHNVSVWTREWLPNLIEQPHLGTRRRYWEALCRHGLEGHERYNDTIKAINGPFVPPAPLLIWAGEEPLRRPTATP
jgi:hypothetical protein